jgi:hypothetical protein
MRLKDLNLGAYAAYNQWPVSAGGTRKGTLTEDLDGPDCE